jgi:hypothetical protein
MKHISPPKDTAGPTEAGPTARSKERRNNTAGRAKGKAFIRSQAAAEQSAQNLIAAVCEYGREALHGITPKVMPSCELAEILHRTVAAVDAGARGWQDVYIAQFMDVEDHVRAAFMDCTEAPFPSSPALCKNTADALRSYHREMQQRKIADKLRQAIEAGDDESEIMREYARLEAEGAAASSSPGFAWHISSGAESWTGDAAELAALSDPPIIHGLLREREVASVIGAAKTSKTWFTLAMALAVARGDPFLGMDTERRKVLYLDYELKPGTFLKRMSLLAADRPEGFYFQCLRGEARLPSVDEIAALVEAEGFGLVVVDSLYRTGWMTEENNNDTTPRDLAPLQDFTRRCAASLVLVDHTGKGGGAEKTAVDAARGASAKGGFWDCLLVLRPTDKGPDKAGNYAILDPVLRDWPRLEALPLVSFTWTATGCEVHAVGEVDRGESDATGVRILEVIAAADRGISRAAIAAAVGIGESTVRRHVDALAGRGKVVSLPDPNHRQRVLYRLADFGDQPRQTPSNPAA